MNIIFQISEFQINDIEQFINRVDNNEFFKIIAKDLQYHSVYNLRSCFNVYYYIIYKLFNIPKVYNIVFFFIFVCILCVLHLCFHHFSCSNITIRFDIKKSSGIFEAHWRKHYITLQRQEKKKTLRLFVFTLNVCVFFLWRCKIHWTGWFFS